MVNIAPRHERVQARIWAPTFERWWPIDYRTLKINGSSDLNVDQATMELEGSTELGPLLLMARDVRVPVHFWINGVVWTGTISESRRSKTDQDDVWSVTVESDHKHAHRLLGRDPVVSAEDASETRLDTTIGDLMYRLWSRGAERTGLPVYLLIEGESDPISVEVRTEDTIADILQDRVVASTSHVDIRMLMPGDELPGEGPVRRYAGAMERAWERGKLDAGWWPDAATHPRLSDTAVDDKIMLPSFSWSGSGTISETGTQVPARVGFCWLPFESAVDRTVGYYEQDLPVAGTRSATRDELEDLQVSRVGTGFPHVTYWAAGTFRTGRDLSRLGDTIERGLLFKTDQSPITSEAEAMSYIGGGAAYAWREDINWYLANTSAFNAERTRRQPNDEQRLTPGLLVHVHPERDRRQVVFSTMEGGGLSGYDTTHTAPDGAQLVAATQMDERLLNSLAGAPTGMAGQLTQLPGGTALPPTVEAVSVDSQPLATMQGTDVSLHNAGGRTNIEAAGPMFLREKYVSITSGGDSPVLDLMREWSEAQGSTSVALSPDYNSGAVFGDDVPLSDGSVMRGWRPGDRVSFVDGDTRLSEVVAGFQLEISHDRPMAVTPILGRQDAGVMAELGERLRAGEKQSQRSLVSPPRRLPQNELGNEINTNPTVTDAKDTATGAQNRADTAWTWADTANGRAGTAQNRADSAWSLADTANKNALSVDDYVNGQIGTNGALRRTVNTMDGIVNGSNAPRVNSNLWRLNNDAWKLQDAFNDAQTKINRWTTDAINVLDNRIPKTLSLSNPQSPGVGMIWVSGGNLYFRKWFAAPCRIQYVAWVGALLAYTAMETRDISGGMNAETQIGVGFFESVDRAVVTIYRLDKMPTISLPRVSL